MSLKEIERAVEALPAKDKQELILFLGQQMREERSRLPEPREFSREQIQSWISEDEADLKRFRGQS